MTSPHGVSGLHSNDIHNPSGYAHGIMNIIFVYTDTPLVVMFYLLHVYVQCVHVCICTVCMYMYVYVQCVYTCMYMYNVYMYNIYYILISMYYISL